MKVQVLSAASLIPRVKAPWYFLFQRFRAVFEKYVRQEGVFDQVNIIMALTMQESGGRSFMQSSESIGLPLNTITDPEYSIEVSNIENI